MTCFIGLNHACLRTVQNTHRKRTDLGFGCSSGRTKQNCSDPPMGGFTGTQPERRHVNLDIDSVVSDRGPRGALQDLLPSLSAPLDQALCQLEAVVSATSLLVPLAVSAAVLTQRDIMVHMPTWMWRC